MARRKSIHIGEFKHANPIPNACRIGNLLMSGVILGRDPATGAMPERIEQQCANMFAHMKAIVEAGGGAMDSILQLTVYLTKIDDYDGMNKVFKTYFPNGGPARTTVAVAALPGNSLVEINCIAAVVKKG